MTAAASPRRGVVAAYVALLQRARWCVLAFWGAAACVCAVWAPGFMADTNTDFDAIEGQQSYDAQQAMKRHFPTIAVSTSVAVFFESLDGADLLSNRAVNRTSAAIVSALAAHYADRPGFVVSAQSFWSMVAAGSSPLAAASNVAAPAHCYSCAGRAALPSCSSCTSAVMSVTFACGIGDKEAQTGSDVISDAIDAEGLRGVRATLIGFPAIIKASVHAAEMNMGEIDAFALPLAMAVLAWILHSFRLLIIPLVNIGVSAATSFGIMDMVAKRMSINSVAPCLMMSTMIAMSIDYSLFLLSRYREELRRVRRRGPWAPDAAALAADRAEVVEVMLRSAGHTITVSALTLTTCMLGLLAIPIVMLWSIGFGCAVSVMLTLLINLSLTPAILFTFPAFFERCLEPMPHETWAMPWDARKWVAVPPAGDGDASESSTSTDESDDDGGGVSAGGEAAAVGAVDHRGSAWYRLATVALTFPYNVLIVVGIVGATVPCDMYMFGNKVDQKMTAALPRGSAVSNAVDAMGRVFGIGVCYPFQVVMEAPNAFSAEYFDKAGELTRQLGGGAVPHVNVSNVLPFGPMFGLFPGGSLGDIWTAFLDPANPASCSGRPPAAAAEICASIALLNASAVAPDGRALLLTIQPQADTLSVDGDDVYQALLDVKAAWERRDPGTALHVGGTTAIIWDGVELMKTSLPKLIGIVSAIVFVLIAAAFRSLLIPLRSICTIGLTLAFTFGFTDLVYEHGKLGWTGAAPFQGNGAIMWTVPPCTFAMIVGIGLDYDIFLLTRIVERLDAGAATVDAIRGGLCDTGRIITAAGIIMGVAFSGLFFSSLQVLNQLAMYLVVSVLFDTFVVRSLLVPALMSLFGRANWWPRRPPPQPAVYAPLLPAEPSWAPEPPPESPASSPVFTARSRTAAESPALTGGDAELPDSQQSGPPRAIAAPPAQMP